MMMKKPSVPPPSGNVRRSSGGKSHPPGSIAPMTMPSAALASTSEISSTAELKKKRRQQQQKAASAGGPADDILVAHQPPAGVAGGESQAMRVFRIVVGLIMVIGIGSGVAYGGRRYVRSSQRFAVNEIVTTGGKRRTPEDIAATASVSKGQNIFSIDLDRSRARLAADPWIESAEVSRQLPGTIAIRIVEREAAGIVAMSEGTYLVTRDGLVIKRVEPGDPIDYHVVTGVPLKMLVDDRDGATRTIRSALDLAYDYDRSPLAQRSPIEEVHVEASGDMTLIVGKQGVVLRMGGMPYRRKLDQATRIVAELDRRGAKPDTIMLDDEARPDRVVVRMR